MSRTIPALLAAVLALAAAPSLAQTAAPMAKSMPADDHMMSSPMAAKPAAAMPMARDSCKAGKNGSAKAGCKRAMGADKMKTGGAMSSDAMAKH